MKRCMICHIWCWSEAHFQEHMINGHALPVLKQRVQGGWVSDWDCASPTHQQAMTLDCYSLVVPWRDELNALLDSLYGWDGEAA